MIEAQSSTFSAENLIELDMLAYRKKREAIEKDLVLAAKTWPLSQLHELLSFDPIHVHLTRASIEHSMIMAAQHMPMPNLLEFYQLVRRMAISGAHNWGVRDIQQRLDAGENPFLMCNEILENFSSLNIENFDDLQDYLGSN